MLYSLPVIGLMIEPVLFSLMQYLQDALEHLLRTVLLTDVILGWDGSSTLALTSMSLMVFGQRKPCVVFQFRISRVLDDLSSISQFCFTTSPRILPPGWYVVMRKMLVVSSSFSLGGGLRSIALSLC